MKIRWLRRDTRGQALLEFALILPLLLMLVLGIVEFGRAWNLGQMMSDVAREGARRAVLADPTITEQSVQDFMAHKLETAGVPIEAMSPPAGSITFSDTNGVATWHPASGTPVTATITIPYSWMFFGRALRPITLTSSFTMRME
jgi:Flp pilus assembly protein TadG